MKPESREDSRMPPDTTVARPFDELDRPRPLPQRVADELLRHILAEGLRPGDSLPSERELAAQFGVSRTVIREGIRSLAGKGVVEVSAGRGIRVASVGLADVQESIRLFMFGRPIADHHKIDEVRETVEVAIAGLAAERCTDRDVALLQSEVEAMGAVVDDPVAASIEDLQFHRALARCTDNEFFLIAIDALLVPLLRIRESTFGPGGRSHEALADHRRILKRVSAHDASGARKAMRAHLRDVERALDAQEPDA